jgi:hypothetical protein
LLLGLYLCYKARALPSDFNESAWVSLALLVQFQSMVMAIPVLAQTTNNPGASYIFKVIIVLLSSLGTVLLIFMPKLWRIHGWGNSGSASNNHSQGKEGAGKVGAKGGPERLSKDRSSGHGSQGLFARFKRSTGNHDTLEGADMVRGAFSLADAVTEYRSQAVPQSSQVKPSTASLDAVTAGTLHSRGAQFYEAMKDKALRAILYSRLKKSYRAEGLEFFTCVLERNHVQDHAERAASTRSIVREFVLNDARRQINISSADRDRIIRGCIEENEENICGDDFFRTPALESCKELIASREFADFAKEFLKEPPPKRPGSKEFEGSTGNALPKRPVFERDVEASTTASGVRSGASSGGVEATKGGQVVPANAE